MTTSDLPGPLRKKWHAVLICSGLLFLSACHPEDPDRVITIPCRTCILKGTELAALSATDRDAVVQDAYNHINNTIWNQAHIQFLGCCQEIPVINDPMTTYGHEGELAFSVSHINPSTEMHSAYLACALAWAQKRPITGASSGFTQGPVVLIARDLTFQFGGPVIDIGITNPRPTSKPVCAAVRNLTASDVEDRYSIVLEPASYGPRINQHMVGSMPGVLAHELGHQLLLEHGNGLDDDGNGTLPPVIGPRLFDANCDHAESGFTEASAGSGSLMGAAYGSFIITPLQRELARDAASVWPGHTP